MNDLSHEIGLARRELRDCRSLVQNLDRRVIKWIEGGDAEPQRDGSLVARGIACKLIGRIENKSAAQIAAERWPYDTVLRSAVAPAMTGVAGWAAEVLGVVITDIADRMLGASVFSQLRAMGLSLDYLTGAITKVPTVAPVASGAFIGEGAPIGVGALLVVNQSLPPKKCASILAITRELLKGSSANVEASVQSIMAEDLSLMVDGILLDATAADAIRPAGLRAGISGLTPSASGTPTEKMMADVKALLGAIAPALRPVLITGTTAGSSISILGPQLAVPVISAPQLAAGMLICVDAAAFCSIVGPLDVSTSEEAVVHMFDPASALVGGTTMPPTLSVIAAPQQSMFQTASVAMRSILDINWLLRRSGAVSWVSGIGW